MGSLGWLAGSIGTIHTLQAWSGYARALVRMGSTPGVVRVVANAKGLAEGSITFDSIGRQKF